MSRYIIIGNSTAGTASEGIRRAGGQPIITRPKAAPAGVA